MADEYLSGASRRQAGGKGIRAADAGLKSGCAGAGIALPQTVVGVVGDAGDDGQAVSGVTDVSDFHGNVGRDRLLQSHVDLAGIWGPGITIVASGQAERTGCALMDLIVIRVGGIHRDIAKTALQAIRDSGRT